SHARLVSQLYVTTRAANGRCACAPGVRWSGKNRRAGCISSALPSPPGALLARGTRRLPPRRAGGAGGEISSGGRIYQCIVPLQIDPEILIAQKGGAEASHRQEQ